MPFCKGKCIGSGALVVKRYKYCCDERCVHRSIVERMECSTDYGKHQITCLAHTHCASRYSVPRNDISDNVLCLQFLKVTFGQAEKLTVNCLVILSKVRSALGNISFSVEQLYRVARNDHVADNGVIEVYEHLSCTCDMLVIDNVCKHVDRSNGDACCIDDGNALLNGVLRAPFFDFRLEFCMILAAENVGGKARILKQIRAI